MIPGIACMQLVEQRKLFLNDAHQVEKLCPELKGLKVLQYGGTLADQEGRITLRMLLSHTCKHGARPENLAADRRKLDLGTRSSMRACETVASQ